MMQRARSIIEKDLRRQALVLAALDEFFERGFAAARMADIAKRAGLSKGTIYLYFASKEELFLALIETVGHLNIERIESAIAMGGGGFESIRLMIRAMPNLIRETPIAKFAKILIGDSGAFPQIVTQYRTQVIEKALALLTGVLRKAEGLGEISVSDAQLTARLVVAPVLMSAIWTVTFEHDRNAKLNLEAFFEQHLELLERALVKRGQHSYA